MDIERSLLELPLCGTPYPMTLGKWISQKHLSLNLKPIYLGKIPSRFSTGKHIKFGTTSSTLSRVDQGALFTQ